MAKRRPSPQSQPAPLAHHGAPGPRKPWSKSQDEPLIPPGYLTLDQASERLRRDPKTIRRMIDYGQVQAYRIGRLLVVSQKSIAAWLKPKPVGPRAREHDTRSLPSVQQAEAATEVQRRA